MMLWMDRGGPVMWPLLLLSLLAATLVIERFVFWMRERGRRAAAVIEARSLEHTENVEEADRLELILDAEQRRLERGMATMDTIIAAAPMLGILGTVLGVIDAFESLAARATPDPMAVTGGISAALITTASGLVIALAVLFPYGFFRTRVRVRLSELEGAARELLTPRGREG
jgi:biopolymer transport protein ExbB